MSSMSRSEAFLDLGGVVSSPLGRTSQSFPWDLTHPFGPLQGPILEGTISSGIGFVDLGDMVLDEITEGKGTIKVRKCG